MYSIVKTEIPFPGNFKRYSAIDHMFMILLSKLF